MKAVGSSGPHRMRQWLVGAFLLGCLLFSYPLLALFNVPVFVAGVPAMYAYLFAAWAALIALVALVVGRRDRP